MARCELCGKEPAIGACERCTKLLCADCRKLVAGRAYCAQHAPAAAPPKPTAQASLLKAIWTVGIVFVGMIVILLIGQYFIADYLAQLQEVPGVMSAVTAMQQVALLITAGIGFILVVLIGAYFVLRQR